MIIEAEPKRTSEQRLIISLENGRNLSFPDKKWYPITTDIALALNDSATNIKRKLHRIMQNDPSIWITTVGKLIDSGRANGPDIKGQYKTFICDRENLIKIMQVYPLTKRADGHLRNNSSGQKTKDGLESEPDSVSQIDAESEEWWKNIMPNKKMYTAKDFWNALKRQEGKENTTRNNVSIQITKYARKLNISGQLMPKSRGFYYTKEDAQKIMRVLLKTKLGRGELENKNNPASPLKTPASANPSSDGHEKNPGKISIEDIENIREQLIENCADIILSRLVSPAGLDGIDNKPEILLNNALKLISKGTALNRIIPMEELGRFLAESFVKRLEEVWNKPITLALSGKEQRTIDYCDELKKQGKTKEKIIQNVCDHFSVPIPEKSDNK